jgi:hypothetical protein
VLCRSICTFQHRTTQGNAAFNSILHACWEADEKRCCILCAQNSSAPGLELSIGSLIAARNGKQGAGKSSSVAGGSAANICRRLAAGFDAHCALVGARCGPPACAAGASQRECQSQVAMSHHAHCTAGTSYLCDGCTQRAGAMMTRAQSLSGVQLLQEWACQPCAQCGHRYFAQSVPQQ